RAGVVLVPENATLPASQSSPVTIAVANPLVAFARAAEILDLFASDARGVHPTALVARGAALGGNVSIGAFAVIDEGARIGRGTSIGHGAVIGAGVMIGSECTIGARAVLLSGTIVGDRVIAHAGCVLGSEGFGFVRDGDVHRKLPQRGWLV